MLVSRGGLGGRGAGPGAVAVPTHPSASLLGVCSAPPASSSFPCSPGHNEWPPGRPCSCPPPGWLEPAFLPPHPLLPTGWREDRPAAHPGPACTPRVTGSRASAAGKPGPPHPAPRPRGCPSEGYRRGTKAQQRGGLTHFPVTRPLPLCPQSLLEPASGGADPTPGVEGLNLSDQGQIPPVLRALVLAPAGWDPGTGW